MAGRMKTRGQLQPAWLVLSEHLHARWCAFLDWPSPEPHSGDLSAELMQLTAADYKLTVGSRPGPNDSGSAMQSYAFKRRFRRARFTQPVTSVVVHGRKRISTRPSQNLALEPCRYTERKRAAHHRGSLRLEQLCRSNGGLYIKAGQHLATLRCAQQRPAVWACRSAAGARGQARACCWQWSAASAGTSYRRSMSRSSRRCSTKRRPSQRT